MIVTSGVVLTGEPPSWHQLAAARRMIECENDPAHIRADNWLRTGKALCGDKQFRVWIDAEHRNNPMNKPCKQCKKIADKAANPDAQGPTSDIFGLPVVERAR